LSAICSEISEKQARSIKYQLTIAKLPLAKDLDDFQFEHTPINETLVRDLASGDFIAQQRRAGRRDAGKTHLANAIARSCVRSGIRGQFYNVVDLVNRLETEARNWSARRSSHPHGLRHPRRTRLSAIRPIRWAAPVPSRQPALRAHLDHRHHEAGIR
jgi:DNA replication protein DnaC